MGRWIRRLLPEPHLNADSKDAVKLALGLVATMTALLLSLLVNAVRGTFETRRNEVVEMSAQVALLDRLLLLYGSDASEARTQFRLAVEDALHRMWPEERGNRAQMAPNTRGGDAFYVALMHLVPQNEVQADVKGHALKLALEIARLRALLLAQSAQSISGGMPIAVICWLVIIFFGFGILAPPNATTSLALGAAAISVAGAVFLILELDQPMDGWIKVSNKFMSETVHRMIENSR
jgi:hypothetical protein